MSNNNQDVSMAPLNDYDALFKIDLNFDADVRNMDDTVLSNYISRVIQGHPYYVSIENVVDVIVDEDVNKVTLIISNKEVGDHIVNTTNNNTNEINQMYNDVAPRVSTDKRLKLINANYKDKKYILQNQDKDGRPVLYEYEFKGFKRPRSLFRNESVKMGNGSVRHFMRNNEGKPFFYDEYMNSTIEYTPEQKVNFIDKRLNIIEQRLGEDSINPKNPRLVRDMVSKLPLNNDISIKTNKLTYASLNESNGLLTNIEMTGTAPSLMAGTAPSLMAGTSPSLMAGTAPSLMAGTAPSLMAGTAPSLPISGVSTAVLNDTAQPFTANVNLNSQLNNPIVNTTFRSINDNTINNVNLESDRTHPAANNKLTIPAANNKLTIPAANNKLTIPVNTTNMTDNKFKNVTMQITNTINKNNLTDVDADNINEETLDDELKNIIKNIKEIEDNRESKNYKFTVGIILLILVIILVGVIVYFVVSKYNIGGNLNNIGRNGNTNGRNGSTNGGNGNNNGGNGNNNGRNGSNNGRNGNNNGRNGSNNGRNGNNNGRNGSNNGRNGSNK